MSSFNISLTIVIASGVKRRNGSLAPKFENPSIPQKPNDSNVCIFGNTEGYSKGAPAP